MTAFRTASGALIRSAGGVLVPLGGSFNPGTVLVDEGFESGSTPWTFSGTSTANGTITLETSGSPEGSNHLTFDTDATLANKYSRVQHNLTLTDGDMLETEFWLFLPTGFYEDMTAAVQIAGFDPFPTANYQCRIIIYDGDELARVYINNNGSSSELTGSWAIPLNQWVRIRWRQLLSSAADGHVSVWMDDTLVASGTDIITLYTGSSDVTRMRWGVVATGDATQTNALWLGMDDISLTAWLN